MADPGEFRGDSGGYEFSYFYINFLIAFLIITHYICPRTMNKRGKITAEAYISKNKY